MKKLLYLAIILILGSCGRKVLTIKIDNLEVMTEDLGVMNWNDAVKACADLGDGWRLPTKDELYILYKNKDKIGGFADFKYWSSTEGNFANAGFEDFANAGFKDFGYGKFNYNYCVRAVRAF